MGLIYKILGIYPTTIEEFKDKIAKLGRQVASGTITPKSRFVHSFGMPETGKNKIWLEYVARDAEGKKLARLVEPFDTSMYSGMHGYNWGSVNTPDILEKRALNLARERATELKFTLEESVTVCSLTRELTTKYI